MTVLLIVLASIAAYVGIGWLLAKRDMPRAWDRARQTWRLEELARESVTASTVAMTLLWPFVGPARLALNLLRSAVAEGDPLERERKINAKQAELRSREREIARMERELGIGRTP